MADLQRALDWAKQHPDDERSKRILELTSSGQLTNEILQSKSIASEQIEMTDKPEEKGFFQRILDNVNQRVENVQGIEQNDQISGMGKAVQTFGQGAGVAADVIATTAGEVIDRVTPDFIEDPIKESFQSGIEKMVQTPQFQEAAAKYSKLKEEHPELIGDLEAVGNILNLAASFTGASAGTKIAGQAVKTGVEKTAAGVAATGRGIGKVGEFATSQSTGLSPSTLRQIIETPGAFTKEEMAKIDATSIANKVKGALDKRMEDLGETGKAYQTLRESDQVVTLRPDTITGVLDKYKINLGEDGKISLTAESPALSQGDITALERFIGQYGKESQLSANAFLNARKGLSELARYDASKTDLTNKISRELRAAYDEQGKTQLSGLTDLDKKYAPEVKFIGKLKKDFLNPDGSLKDNALSKLSNLTGSNKDIVLKRVESLVPGITQDVNILKAIKDIEYAKGQKVGAYLRGGTAGFLVSGGNPIMTIISAIATSPQVAIPMIRAYGNVKQSVKGTVGSVIKKLKTGNELVGDEIQVFQDALNSASQKVQDRIKNVRPGMNIQDVNTMTPEQRKQINIDDIEGLFDESGVLKSVRLKEKGTTTEPVKTQVVDELKDQAVDRVKKLDEIINKVGPKASERLMDIRGELDVAKPTKAALQKAEKEIEDYSVFLKGRKTKLNELRSLAKGSTFDEFQKSLKTVNNRYAIRLRNNEELAKEFFIASKRTN